LLAFVLALLEPWQDDLMASEDLPDAMDVLMACPSLCIDVDDTMQKAFDLVGWTPAITDSDTSINTTINTMKDIKVSIQSDAVSKCSCNYRWNRFY